MLNNKKYAGYGFLIAAVSSIIGLKLYDPVLINSNFLDLNSSEYNKVVFGAVCELILACSATSTCMFLFPNLKLYSTPLAIGYVCFRMMEVVFIVIGMISVLGLLSLNSQYIEANSSRFDEILIVGSMLKGIHTWTFILGPNFMLGINTFIYSYVFYQTRMIPRNLSIWGILASMAIFTASFLELFGIIKQISIVGILLAIPIASYELTLSYKLIYNRIK